jgi:hypothetical protein
VVFLAPPDELTSIYGAIDMFTREYLRV